MELNLSTLTFRIDPVAIIQSRFSQSSMPGDSKRWNEDLDIYILKAVVKLRGMRTSTFLSISFEPQ